MFFFRKLNGSICECGMLETDGQTADILRGHYLIGLTERDNRTLFMALLK